LKELTETSESPLKLPCALREGVCRGECISPLILNLGTRLRWMASLTPRPLYTRYPLKLSLVWRL